MGPDVVRAFATAAHHGPAFIGDLPEQARHGRVAALRFWRSPSGRAWLAAADQANRAWLRAVYQMHRGYFVARFHTLPGSVSNAWPLAEFEGDATLRAEAAQAVDAARQRAAKHRETLAGALAVAP